MPSPVCVVAFFFAVADADGLEEDRTLLVPLAAVDPAFAGGLTGVGGFPGFAGFAGFAGLAGFAGFAGFAGLTTVDGGLPLVGGLSAVQGRGVPSEHVDMIT